MAHGHEVLGPWAELALPGMASGGEPAAGLPGGFQGTHHLQLWLPKVMVTVPRREGARRDPGAQSCSDGKLLCPLKHFCFLIL